MSNGGQMQLLSTCASDPCYCKKPGQPPGGGGLGPGQAGCSVNINQIEYIYSVRFPDSLPGTFGLGQVLIATYQDSAYSPVYAVQTGSLGGQLVYFTGGSYTYNVVTTMVHCCHDPNAPSGTTCDPAQDFSTGSLSGGSDPVGDQSAIALSGQAAINAGYVALGFSPPVSP